jgi:hypothetical protein
MSPSTYHVSSLSTFNSSRGKATTSTMRGHRCLLFHVLCFPVGHCFQTRPIGNIFSPRYSEGPRKESFSPARRPGITCAPLLATPRTTSASATPESDSTMVDQGVSLIGKTTSMLVAGTFFSVLVWKRDALMGKYVRCFAAKSRAVSPHQRFPSVLFHWCDQQWYVTLHSIP